jgi:hypothetical protein
MNTLTIILLCWLALLTLWLVACYIEDKRKLNRWRRSLCVGRGVVVCYDKDCFDATITDFEYCQGFWEVTRTDGRSYVVADGNIYPKNYFVD